MLVMYLCVRGIDVGHVFVCEGYRCWSYICVLGVSMLVKYLFFRISMLVMYLFFSILMLVMYLCVLVIDVGHVSVCEGYRCWSCICV